MNFQLLGPLRIVADDGKPLVLERRRDRGLLGVLLLEPRKAISVDRLIDLLWDGEPPALARRALQVHVARIRTAIRAAYGRPLVDRSGPGYLIDIDPETVDVHRFRILVERAADQPVSTADRAALLRQALDLWHGPMLVDIAGSRLWDRLCLPFEELRLKALEDWLEAEVDLGNHSHRIPDLAQACLEHPDRERLAGLHMLALHRSGRTAKASEVYTSYHRYAAETTGIEPSPALSDLHTRILRADVSLTAPDVNGEAPAPSSLPRDIPGFAGRTAELAELDRYAAGAVDALVTAVTGVPGVGKTALCLHWAHRAAPRYPDGQLYVNLRGHDRSRALRPAEAIGQLLRQLGALTDGLPADEDEAIALYRIALAGKRVLMVLDNAMNPEQVRPLLPAAPGSLALITSRNRLQGLTASDGALRMLLGVLHRDESVALLVAMLGAGRVQQELSALDDLARTCGDHPLALRIAAADLADREQLTIAAYIPELTQGNRLDALSFADDPDIAIRHIFSQAYNTLNAGSKRAFRLLGQFGATHYTASSAAALWNSDAAWTMATLDALLDMHLLEQTRPGIYELHDLLHDFAASIAADDDDADDATLRLVQHLAFSADEANSVLNSASPGSIPEAMNWLEQERANLIEAVTAAAARGWNELASRLVLALWRFFHLAGHTGDWIYTAELVIASAGDTLDDATSAALLNTLGAGYMKAGRYDQAIDIHTKCVAIRESLADFAGAARSHGNLSASHQHQGRYGDALREAEIAMDLARRAGDYRFEVQLATGSLVALYSLLGEHQLARETIQKWLPDLRELGGDHDVCRAICNLSEFERRIGMTDAALEHALEALELSRQLGDRSFEAGAFCLAGCAYRDLGQFSTAIELLTKGLELGRQVRMRVDECEALNDLAAVFVASGEPAKALELYLESLALAESLGAAGFAAAARESIAAMRDR